MLANSFKIVRFLRSIPFLLPASPPPRACHSGTRTPGTPLLVSAPRLTCAKNKTPRPSARLH